jgi:hypothetical protein
MDQSLIYVSTRCPGADGASADVSDIVAVSRPRNAAFDVTGALVATPTFFAQILEGPEAHLAELMASIRRDQRHRSIMLVDLGGRARRDFADWSLAYSGEATHVSQTVGRLMEQQGFDFPKHVNRLYFMIRELVE